MEVKAKPKTSMGQSLAEPDPDSNLDHREKMAWTLTWSGKIFTATKSFMS